MDFKQRFNFINTNRARKISLAHFTFSFCDASLWLQTFINLHSAVLQVPDRPQDCSAQTQVWGKAWAFWTLFSTNTVAGGNSLASASTHHTQAMVPFLLEHRTFSPKGRSKRVWCCQKQGFWQWNTWSSPDLADPALADLQSHQEIKWSCGQKPFPFFRF